MQECASLSESPTRTASHSTAAGTYRKEDVRLLCTTCRLPRVPADNQAGP